MEYQFEQIPAIYAIAEQMFGKFDHYWYSNVDRAYMIGYACNIYGLDEYPWPIHPQAEYGLLGWKDAEGDSRD